MIDIVLTDPMPLAIALVAAGVALKQAMAGRAATPVTLPVRHFRRRVT